MMRFGHQHEHVLFQGAGESVGVLQCLQYREPWVVPGFTAPAFH